MKFWRLPLDADQHSIPIGQLHIIEDRCKGCNFCIEFCPNKVLVVSRRFNVKGYHSPEVIPGKEIECVNCNLCELICPEFAIYSTLQESKKLTKEDIDRYYRQLKHRGGQDES